MRMPLFLPILIAAALVGAALITFPLKTTARDVVPWPALTSYFDQDFRAAGFSITCVSGIDETCTVNWSNPADRFSDRIAVYSFADEQDLTRDDILRRFHERASKVAGQSELRRASGVLDGFFQSGLRRMADRSMRRARDGSTDAFLLPPFRLSELRRVRGKDIREVESLDPSFSTITTGLPRKPNYQADVIAPASSGAASTNAMTLRIVRSVGASVVQTLDPASPRTCRDISPDGKPDPLPCRAVTITGCIASKNFACRSPVLEIHAMAPGIALVRSAGNGDARLLSRGGRPLTVDELLIARADAGKRFEPLQVESTRPGVISDFRVELIHGGDVALSRLRMVNGRWERWYEPSVQPWVQPLVTRWEQLADERRTRTNTPDIDPRAAVRLTVDLTLQQALENRLASWMRDGGWEEAVRNHLAAAHYRGRRHRLTSTAGEREHRRPVPHAGVTLLDAKTGNILAGASYPPARALVTKDGQPSFAPGWRERLAGDAPAWAAREILDSLSDRVTNDANANFVTHPIGSTFKPLLLSLTLDARPRGGAQDGLDRLFNLMVAGHPPPAREPAPLPYSCPQCAEIGYEAVAGLPLGPYGSEEGSWQHKQDDWIDRSEFLVASCNKYAVTLGVLSLFDWTRPSDGSNTACCWNTRRDSFALSPNQTADGRSAAPYPTDVYSHATQVPPLGPWIEPTQASTTARFADAPIFTRLERYYGVPARSQPDAYDALPWAKCVGLDALAYRTRVPRMGTVARTQLSLTGQIVGPSFTNLFTGAGHNWWSSVKLAEAYARLAMNKEMAAGFCGGNVAQQPLFSDTSRHAELLQILSRQRTASWMHLDNVNAWIAQGPKRVALSKTGTTLRMSGYASTGVLALFAGEAEAMVGPHPSKIANGIVMVVYVDDIGKSEQVTRLADQLFAVVKAGGR
jgi:hypothetical protein